MKRVCVRVCVHTSLLQKLDVKLNGGDKDVVQGLEAALQRVQFGPLDAQ